MLKNNKISRVLSLIVAIVLVLASVPVKEVKAAENGLDIFVITSFDKQDEWTMEKTTFVPGTKTQDMGFPTEWLVKGYLKLDKTQTEFETTLKELTWEGYLLPEVEETDTLDQVRTKIDAEKIYSEKAEAGTYLFVLQLPIGVTLAEEVKAPAKQIEIREAEEPKPEEPKAEEPKAEEPKPEEPKAEEPKPEEPKAEEPKPEEPKAEEPKPEEPKAEEPKPEKPKAEEPKPEKPKAEEPKPEEPKAEEPKPEEPKPEEPKPEEPKPEEPVEKTWTLAIEDLPERILKGASYQLHVQLEGEGTDPDNLPAFAYEVKEGNEIVTVDEQGKITILGEGKFEIEVSLKALPEGVTCAPASVKGEAILPDTDAVIHSFRIDSWKGEITEDDKGSSIEVTVPYGTDVTALKPEFEIGAYASCDKISGEAQDFTDPVIYTVTAEDGVTKRIYTVKVTAVCAHDWKEATCTEPETCSICKETRGKAKGHEWKAATCTEAKICAVCEKKDGEALGHDWKEADCTHPETCERCKAVRGEALGHNWAAWKTTKKPTTKEAGLEERVCARCEEKETREIPRLNIIGQAKNNVIKGIKEKGVYGVDEVITISAYGDGMGIEKPIKNDVRYVPKGWKVTSYTAWKKAPYKVSFSVKAEGSYQLQVEFQKQIFDGENWINQKEVDVKKVNFTVDADKIVPVKTGDEAPIEVLAGLMILAMFAIAAVGAGWKLRKRNR